MLLMTEVIQDFLDEFTSRTSGESTQRETEDESPFDFAVLVQGAVLYIVIRGELEFHHTDRFNEAINPSVAEPSCKNVVVHMGQVSFVDSTGLATLVNAAQTVKERGGHVHLVGCTPFVVKTLEITRLKRVFQVHDTFEVAYDAANETVDEKPA